MPVPSNFLSLGDPLPFGRPEINLPRVAKNHPFRWQDWFSCGGCLSLVIAFVVVAIFGDDFVRLLVNLARY